MWNAVNKNWLNYGCFGSSLTEYSSPWFRKITFFMVRYISITSVQRTQVSKRDDPGKFSDFVWDAWDGRMSQGSCSLWFISWWQHSHLMLTFVVSWLITWLSVQPWLVLTFRFNSMKMIAYHCLGLLSMTSLSSSGSICLVNVSLILAFAHHLVLLGLKLLHHRLACVEMMELSFPLQLLLWCL